MFDPDKSIHAYLTGNHSSWETRELIHWMNESSENKRLFKAIQEYWENTNEIISLDQANIDQAFQKLSKSIFEKDNTKVKPSAKMVSIATRSKSNKTVWLSVAASVAVIIGVFMFTSHLTEAKSDIEVISIITKENPAGRKSQIFLPDGTAVKLNSNSQLKFPESFSNTERIVYLDGEAFFDVAKNAEKPFLVVSGSITTTALGTSFNVKSNNNIENVKVALVSGKVEVKDDKGSSVILTPNEMVTYNEGKINKRLFDYNNEIAWSEGKLYFNQKSLSQVFVDLEEWYGFDFEFELNDPLKGKYSGEFANNPSLERVMDGVSYASNFNYEIIGNKILIKN